MNQIFCQDFLNDEDGNVNVEIQSWAVRMQRFPEAAERCGAAGRAWFDLHYPCWWFSFLCEMIGRVGFNKKLSFEDHTFRFLYSILSEDSGKLCAAQKVPNLGPLIFWNLSFQTWKNSSILHLTINNWKFTSSMKAGIRGRLQDGRYRPEWFARRAITRFLSRVLFGRLLQN